MKDFDRIFIYGSIFFIMVLLSYMASSFDSIYELLNKFLS